MNQLDGFFAIQAHVSGQNDGASGRKQEAFKMALHVGESKLYIQRYLRRNLLFKIESGSSK